MSVYTYTYTRTDTLVDQVDQFLMLSGLPEDDRIRIMQGVNAKVIVRIGVYILKNGKRMLEGALGISWSAHSDHAEITVSGDLPGWADGVAPELSILATRLHQYANSISAVPNYFVSWTQAVRSDAALLASWRKAVGVVEGPLPEWNKTPETHRIPLQDLPEAYVSLSDGR